MKHIRYIHSNYNIASQLFHVTKFGMQTKYKQKQNLSQTWIRHFLPSNNEYMTYSAPQFVHQQCQLRAKLAADTDKWQFSRSMSSGTVYYSGLGRFFRLKDTSQQITLALQHQTF